ncbi:uncharacterized protein [Paramormyrops kingsleyae]|uniref:uncharacterized protein n=1 Tax=Paramormyrops kingsleyae TaxID=1676925 RepID=UPI003B97B72E
MTNLLKDALQQGEDLWLVLLHEVTYWRELPEIRGDPGLFALAEESWDLLQEVNPRTEERIMAEVRSLLLQLTDQVRERWLQPPTWSEATLPLPSGLGRRKEKRRRGRREETDPTIVVGRYLLSPASLLAGERGESLLSDDVPAATLTQACNASGAFAKEPLLATYQYRPARLANRGARAAWNAIPRVPRTLKGAAPDPPAAAAAAVLPAAPPATAAAALPAVPPATAAAAFLETPLPVPRQGRHPPGPRLSVSRKGRGHRRRAEVPPALPSGSPSLGGQRLPPLWRRLRCLQLPPPPFLCC